LRCAKNPKYLPVQDGEAVPPFVEDLVTAQLVKHSKGDESSLLASDAVPVYLMLTPARPLVVVDSKTFDPFLRVQRLNEDLAAKRKVQSLSENSEGTEKAARDMMLRPYIFFADHTIPILELGTVFSFENVLSAGSVSVSCRACLGFLMNRVAAVP